MHRSVLVKLPLSLLMTALLAACSSSAAPEATAQAAAPQASAAEVTAPEKVTAPAAQAGSFNLDDLASYEPALPVTGTIRSYGFGLGGVLEQWQEGFRKIHPDVVFDNNLPTSDAAFPALVTRVTDLGPNGSEPAITEALSFFETRGYHPSDVIVATGSFDKPSRSNGPVVFVHKDNPLTQLTIDQLDGIFGAERTGGMRGFEWTPSDGRGADKNIRTWGELGVTGKWADKPIQTYGHAASGTARFFQLHVLANTDKWNPNYRAYVETGSKMIAAEDKAEQKLGIQHMLRNELLNDRYGIAWTIMSQAQGIEGLKPIALAPRGSTNYVMPSEESFQNRSYPLARNIYIYFDREPGKAMDPRFKEFLRYALSREGQRMVGDAGYLPLPAHIVQQQLAKLE